MHGGGIGGGPQLGVVEEECRVGRYRQKKKIYIDYSFSKQIPNVLPGLKTRKCFLS